MKEIVDATYEHDFNSNPWKWMEMFIKCHDINTKEVCFNLYFEIKYLLNSNAGLVDDGDMKFLSKLDTKLHTQMSLDKDRLAFVACIVKDCKHNRLGDMIVTIKVSGNAVLLGM